MLVYARRYTRCTPTRPVNFPRLIIVVISRVFYVHVVVFMPRTVAFTTIREQTEMTMAI